MKEQTSNGNKHAVSAAAQLDVGLGSTGCLIARCARARRFEVLKKLLRVNDPAVFQREIERLYSDFYADSEAPVEQILEAAFAGESELVLPTPRKYVLLTAHAGRTLIDRANTPPFEHLQRWSVPLVEIEDKSAQCEAEGVRLYGTANVFANIQIVWQQLSRSVRQTLSVRNSPEWLRLRARGMTLNPHLRLFNIYFSSAGGQASGAVVTVLALLHLLIRDERQNCFVRLHFLAPGFYPAHSESESLDHAMKTQSVIRDLHQLMQKETTLHLPFPKGDKQLNDTTQLFDEIFIHEPTVSDLKERYTTFIRRVSDIAVAMELAPFARGLRSMRSNSAAASRAGNHVNRMFAS